MVKVRPGSRKGKCKFTTSRKNIARVKAGRLRKRAHQQQHVAHPAIREMWNKSLTPSENLARVGLCSSVNVVHKKPESEIRVVKLSDVQKLEEQKKRRHGEDGDGDLDMAPQVMQRLEADSAVPERGSKQVVRPGERVALQRLVDRYGLDWTKMARDIKLNYLQWTPAQLEKRVTRMQSILELHKQ